MVWDSRLFFLTISAHNHALCVPSFMLQFRLNWPVEDLWALFRVQRKNVPHEIAAALESLRCEVEEWKHLENVYRVFE